MDLALLGLEYASYYAVQITLKGAIYSLKLKLEFAVLGRLVDVIHGHRRPMIGRDAVHLCSLEFNTGPNNGTVPPGMNGDVNVCEISAMNNAEAGKIKRTTTGSFNGRISDGKILAMTEFSTWVEQRCHGNGDRRMA